MNYLLLSFVFIQVAQAYQTMQINKDTSLLYWYSWRNHSERSLKYISSINETFHVYEAVRRKKEFIMHCILLEMYAVMHVLCMVLIISRCWWPCFDVDQSCRPEQRNILWIMVCITHCEHYYSVILVCLDMCIQWTNFMNSTSIVFLMIPYLAKVHARLYVCSVYIFYGSVSKLHLMHTCIIVIVFAAIFWFNCSQKIFKSCEKLS